MGMRFFFDGDSIESDPADLRPGDEVCFLPQPGPLSRATNVSKQLARADSLSTGQAGSGDISASYAQSHHMDIQPTHDPETDAILQQTRVTHAGIQHSLAAVLVALDWKAGDGSSARKIATVQQSLEALLQQVERAFISEEQDGLYVLHFTAARRNSLTKSQEQHQPIIAALTAVSNRLRKTDSSQPLEWDDLEYEIRRVVMAIDEHLRREAGNIADEFGVDVSSE